MTHFRIPLVKRPLVIEPMHINIVLYQFLSFVCVEHPDKAGQDWFLTDSHQIGVVLTENCRRLFQMIMRNLNEEMMNLVSSNMMCQMMSPSVISVNTGQLTWEVRNIKD